MQKDIILNKPVWFVNPWFDVVFLTCIPIIITVPIFYYCQKFIPHLAYVSYALFNFPHVLAGLIFAYLLSRGYNKNPVGYLVFPVFIFSGAVIAYALGHAFGLNVIRFVWGNWHVLVQYLYILFLSKLLNNDYSRIDKLIDILTLASGFVYLVSRYIFQMQSILSKGAALRLTLDANFLKFIVISSWVIVAVFIFRQVYLFFKLKKVYIFKILLISNAILLYLTLPLIKGVYIVNQTLILLHTIQYIAWVWMFYYKLRSKEARPNCLFAIGQIKLSFIYFLLVLSFSAVISYFLFKWHHGSKVTMGFAYVHFFVDSLIWGGSRAAGVFQSAK